MHVHCSLPSWEAPASEVGVGMSCLFLGTEQGLELSVKLLYPFLP